MCEPVLFMIMIMIITPCEPGFRVSKRFLGFKLVAFRVPFRGRNTGCDAGYNSYPAISRLFFTMTSWIVYMNKSRPSPGKIVACIAINAADFEGLEPKGE